MKMILFLPKTPVALVAALWLLLSANSAVAMENKTEDVGSNHTSTKLSLAASNHFRMVIRPTLFELDFVAISILEEATERAILSSADPSLVDVNINVNQMNWLSPVGGNNDELIDGTVNALGVEAVPTTVLKFFAVGTFLVKVPAGATTEPGSLAAVKALDEIIKNAFSLQNYGDFIGLLHDSGEPLLEGVQDAVVIKTNTNPTVPASASNNGNSKDASEDSTSGFKSWDYLLVAFGVAFSLLMVYLIYQHSKDREYVANRRRQVLDSYNRRNNNNETSSYYSHQSTEEEKNRPEKAASMEDSIKSSQSSKTSIVRNGQVHGEQPSNTSSSIFTSNTEEPHSFITNFNLPPPTMDINSRLAGNSRRGRYSSKVRISIESVQQCDSRSLPPLPTTSMMAVASASSEQSADEKSECKSTGALSFAGLSTALSSDFGPINWFRDSASKGLSIMNSNDASSNIEVPVEDEAEEETEDEEAAPVPVSKKIAATSSSSSSSSCDSSESDVFHIGKAHARTPESVTNGSDSVSKASSVVTEWMKTIRVVASTDSNSGSEVTCKGSSSEQSSTAANSSTEAPSVDDADEVASLEHSMANSRSLSVMSGGFGEAKSVMSGGFGEEGSSAAIWSSSF